MGLSPWETSDSQYFTLITGANSGLGYSIAARLLEEFLTSPDTPSTKHLILIICTRTPMKTRFTISRLRAHLRKIADYSSHATALREKAKARGDVYKWEDTVQKVHFLGVEADLCNLRSVYALADRLVNGTVGSPDATTMDGGKLPHGSPGTRDYSNEIEQDRWALSQRPGSTGAQRSWGWGLSGIRVPRLDAVVLNAGMGGWTGVDWLGAVSHILRDPIDAITWPNFKISSIGKLAKSQLNSDIKNSSNEETQPLLSAQEKPEEPPLGEIFCANVFGHYILAHELMPLLSQPASAGSKHGGKIMWMSSVEAGGDSSLLDVEDIQGVKSEDPYGSSKRLVDVLALTSDLPSVKKEAASFFDAHSTTTTTSTASPARVKPRMFTVHPGVFVSDIMPMNAILTAIYTALFYVLRLCGSIWHPIDPWRAAVAPVWVCLLDEEAIDRTSIYKAKWGSATDRWGEERVIKTEVPGWGFDGSIENAIDLKGRLGRRKNAVAATKESREDFEILGATAWAKMEQLRKKWEDVLGIRKENN